MKNVPKLRFSGFSDEWREFELGDLAEISKGKYNPSKDKLNYKCIELEHIAQNDGKILGYVDSKGQNSIKNKFNKGEVLFGKLRPYLKKYWLSEFEGVCSSEIWVLNGKRVTNPFLYRIVQSDKFDTISNISSGSKMPRADWNYMSTEVFNIPTTEEQEKIASFLTKVDKIIEKQEEKVSNLEQYKKGMMQKIFSQEIRFKKDDGGEYPDWETKNIGQIFSVNAGGDISKEHVSQNISEEFCYPIYSNSLNDKGLYGYSDIYKVGGETITVTGRGTVGVACARYEEYYPIVRLLVLQKKSKCNVKYFEEAINNTKIFIESTGVPQLTSPQLSDVKVLCPCFDEQNKIANLLSKIDSIVEKENEKLEELRTWKKGLLQGMFV